MAKLKNKLKIETRIDINNVRKSLLINFHCQNHSKWVDISRGKGWKKRGISVQCPNCLYLDTKPAKIYSQMILTGKKQTIKMRVPPQPQAVFWKWFCLATKVWMTEIPESENGIVQIRKAFLLQKVETKQKGILIKLSQFQLGKWFISDFLPLVFFH